MIIESEVKKIAIIFTYILILFIFALTLLNNESKITHPLPGL